MAIADTVDLGMCLVNDSLSTTFILQNTGDRILRISNVDPSFFLGKPLNFAQNDYEEFSCAYPELPFNINKNTTLYMKIKYFADSDLDKYPIGKKCAFLKLGLYDPEYITDPKPYDLTTHHDYIIISRKTNKYIDAYDSIINFDSVYVNSKPVLKNQVKLQNVSKYDLKLESCELKNIGSNTIDGEFVVKSDNNDSLTYNSGSIKSWSIYYSPQNRGWDTAAFVVKYKPDPINFPDSLENVTIQLLGYGVEQQIVIFKSINADFDVDTVDIGEIRINTPITFSVILKNIGNLPYGAVSQAIYKENSEENDPNFIIEKYILNGGKNLVIDAFDTLKVTFLPQKSGMLVARYIIESDLNYRSIYGVPNKAVKKYIYLKGVSVEPIITLSTNLIDFGNVTVSTQCPNTIDSTIYISNTGNQILHIYSVEFDPLPPTPFNIEPQSCDINPGEKVKFSVSFNTDGLYIGNKYNVQLNFLTNCNLSSAPMFLKAKSVAPQSINLNIPRDLKIKPGNSISVPIISEKEKILNANEFKTEIYYDKYVLKYIDYDNISTASENSVSIIIKDYAEEGKISISIKAQASGFLLRDTLIKIDFATYLGDKISSPITFKDPSFGNSNCTDIFTLNNPENSNGVITLDSICGLNLKTISPGSGKFALEFPYPNPTENHFKFNFSVAFKSKITITLYNNYGEAVKTMINEDLPSGLYNFDIETSGLAPGIYYCDMQAYLFRKTIPISISK